ncbi:hypothetical protein CH063_14318 [Colletotrichum higginsianum]|uniref:Uncharacterized protein n=1 Tax=Colletotrichum higginsianum (strain IMI 349063) TaxID=759273 RepID=H1VY31_COLHI|nr:hypothetical protein CH063_14318 [Colletotrichum higginsianum]
MGESSNRASRAACSAEEAPVRPPIKEMGPGLVDLSSEAAMELAELDGWEFSFDRLARTVEDRALLMDVALCCETERSRGREGGSESMIGGR